MDGLNGGLFCRVELVGGWVWMVDGGEKVG